MTAHKWGKPTQSGTLLSNKARNLWQADSLSLQLWLLNMSGSAAPKKSGRNASMYTGPSEPFGLDWNYPDRLNQKKGDGGNATAEAGEPAKSNPSVQNKKKHGVRTSDIFIELYHEQHLTVTNCRYSAAAKPRQGFIKKRGKRRILQGQSPRTQILCSLALT